MWRRLAFFCALLTFLFIGLVFAASNLIKQQYLIELPVAQTTYFEIAEGESKKSVIEKLAAKNLISYPELHYTLIRLLMLYKANLSFKAGEYAIKPGDTYRDLLQDIQKGKVFLRKITIAEGQTSKEVTDLLNNNEFLSGEPISQIAEGSILPETYLFKKNYDRNLLLQQMQAELKKFAAETWTKRAADLPLKNIDELLILASIVEKETGKHAERDRIAGVFINRINLGMKLQSDPTVIYAVTKGQYKLTRPLSKRDLRIKSPYSTYHKYGLPPTPIANAGKAAILATANPKKSKELYFVSDGKGKHRFSKTLRQHNYYVRLLRKFEREQKNAKRP